MYNLNEHDIISAATLPELDEAYTRRIHNFRSVQELYKWSSCIFYLDNITTPMVFINAIDDPIVPEVLLNPIKEHAANHLNTLYVELAHGGHLGFYEGGFLYPNPPPLYRPWNAISLINEKIITSHILKLTITLSKK